MNSENHYYSSFPDSKVRFHTISVTLRRHLYLFKTISGVFSYKKLDLGTKILVENMIIPQKPSNLMDLGCGYGVIGIVLAHESPLSKIYLIDVNKRAIWCTKENVKINMPTSKSRFFIMQGSYFEPLKDKKIMFDGIYMNPALRQGRRSLLNLLSDLSFYLKSTGTFQFVVRKKMGADYILKYIKDQFSEENVEVICKKSGYWVFRFGQQKLKLPTNK
ncbi:MAG: class I SAM-dependent methyltransferase [Promethearchaeota archaeon]